MWKSFDKRSISVYRENRTTNTVLELLREESAGKEKEEKIVEIEGGEISAIEEILRGFESE